MEVTPGEFQDLKSSEVYSFRGTTGGAGEATVLELTADCHRQPASCAHELSLLPWPAERLQSYFGLRPPSPCALLCAGCILLSMMSPLTCAGEAEAAQISLAASPMPAPQAEPASSPAGPGSRSAGQVQPAGQPGAVSAPEMMAAVRDMLAAADVPLDLERSQLLQQTLELRAQLEGAQSRLTTAEQVAALCAGAHTTASRSAWSWLWLQKSCAPTGCTRSSIKGAKWEPHADSQPPSRLASGYSSLHVLCLLQSGARFCCLLSA